MKRPNLRIVSAFLADESAPSRRAFGWVAGVTAAVVVAGGAAVRHSDAATFDSIWEGLWWASTTVTTVGYGDVVPTTVTARLVAVVLMFVGIGLVSILTAAIASALLAEDVGDEERHIDRQLAEMTRVLASIDARLEAIERDAQAPSCPPACSCHPEPGSISD